MHQIAGLFIVGLTLVACQSPASTASLAAEVASSTDEVRPLDLAFVTSDGIRLEGTLTLPAHAATKVPAILLVPGSGPTDRDGNQAPQLTTDLLRQIATDLARAGIATYRFDKRAASANRANWPRDPAQFPTFFAWPRFVDDVVAAFKTMSARSEIDAARCAILGHSEGGLLALAASAHVRPAALMLVATAGRPLGLVLNTQLKAQVDALVVAGVITAATGAQLLAESDRIQRFIVKNGVIPTDVPVALAPIYGSPAAALLLQVELVLDPEAAAAGFAGPVMVMNGTLDQQVDPVLDARPLFAALASRSHAAQDLSQILGRLPRTFSFASSCAFRAQLTRQEGTGLPSAHPQSAF